MVMVKGSEQYLQEKAAHIISGTIGMTLVKKDTAALAVCGGRNVQGIFGKLKNKDIDWRGVHIFMSDERLVPIDDPESNYKLAYDTFIQDLKGSGRLSDDNLHPFVYTGNIDRDLKAYERDLLRVSDHFDIVLLSAGEDGHVAALYPGHETIANTAPYFISTMNSPKMPRERMSSSRSLIGRSSVAVVMFMGGAKALALRRFNDVSVGVNQCPAKLVNSVNERYILTDQA